tara:strand:+ start:1171 stop:1899 length:729 start_codon:yes stop_codon:yes gene_type:complete
MTASNFEASEWYMTLSGENRFTPKKKKIAGKNVFVVNTGFVVQYSSLRDFQKREVRRFLISNFKKEPFISKFPDFSKMNDKNLREFMDDQERYLGREVYKESTAKKHLKKLPQPPKEEQDPICLAYKIINGLIMDLLERIEREGLKVDTELLLEHRRLTTRITSCKSQKPDEGFYDNFVSLLKSKHPTIELQKTFNRLLTAYPPDLKAVEGYIKSLQKSTRFLYRIKVTKKKKGGGKRTKKI